ncbi:hypothetical protein COO60DRAFT_1465227 [Scenedesmus sp. NREL 46B-D3]|nr:hypothetical protein COO60DRAFT_1465227 [Scenedesmus sp. NREL 46B-D3]
MPHDSSTPLDLPDSPAGYLCLNVPPWVASPPIEAVVFGWGASEDHQLGLDSEEGIDNPKWLSRCWASSSWGCHCLAHGDTLSPLALLSWLQPGLPELPAGWWQPQHAGHRRGGRAVVLGLERTRHAGPRAQKLHANAWARCRTGQHDDPTSLHQAVFLTLPLLRLRLRPRPGNEYQQCGLVAPDEQPQPGSQAAALQAAAAKAAAAPGAASGTEGLLAAAAAAVAKAAGMAGAAVGGSSSLGRSGTAESSANGTANGAANGAADAYTYSSVYGVLPAARDILVPRCCMPGLAVKQVACGGMNSVVLTEGGEVWTWGEPWGEFALELQRAPRKVPGAVGIASIACGAFHNMALVADGRVLAWGTNDYGQLGNGSTIYSTTPVEVAVADIAAGGWHSMALSADGQGQIYVWGRGEYGRLGIADRTGSSKLRPHKVRGLEGHSVVQVAAGGTHSLAVTSSGRMFIWGRASYGRLGLGPAARDQYSPVEVALPGGHERWKVAAATAGGRHTMCLAVPVREASLRRDGSRAGSLASTSRGPSRAASQRGGTGHPGMGVEAVHAAAAAAAAAAQLGGARVGSPALGSSSGGAGLAALQQHRQQWGGSAGGLRPGEQLPLSPRAVPPPMSPSQRRVGFDLGSALNSEPSAAGLLEGDSGIPTQHEACCGGAKPILAGTCRCNRRAAGTHNAAHWVYRAAGAAINSGAVCFWHVEIIAVMLGSSGRGSLSGVTRRGPAVKRGDSGVSQVEGLDQQWHSRTATYHSEGEVMVGYTQEGLSGLADAEDMLLGGESPTGSSTGRGGGSPSSSDRLLEGLGGITGTSPPGGVYDVGLGDAAARCANSHPGREYIHYSTHLA